MSTDLRYAFRQLRNNRGFAAIAILTVGIGIGANTAIFSLVDAVILRPLGYRDVGRLVVIHENTPQFGLIPVNALHFQEWRDTTRAFEEMALLEGHSANLTGDAEPERVDVGRVSASLFPMLGVRAQVGRTFLKDEDQAGHNRVAVIDDRLWRRRFAGLGSVVGRVLVLDGTPYEIIGVLPTGFHFPKLGQLYSMSMALETPEVWIPFVAEPHEVANPMGQFNFACIARLKPGVSPAQAVSQINVVQERFASQAPQKVDLTAALVPLQDQVVSRSRRGLEVALAAVGTVLIIGCVNIANLLLSRISSRSREMAIRAAIGASRGRLVRQTLVEALVLSAPGALCGLVLAYISIPLILSVAPGDVPRLDEVHLNLRVLLFALTITTLTGLSIGLLSGWRSAKAESQLAMTSALRPALNRSGNKIRSLLVTVEVALTTMCLIAGGLLLHSFLKLLEVDRGFDTERILTVDLNFGLGPNSRYSNEEKKIAFVNAALDRLRVIPGVFAVGVSDRLPLSGEGGNSAIYLDGRDVPLFERPNAAVRAVNTDYFRTLGIALETGRLFDDRDGARPVAVISSSLAKRAWPGESPIGKQFRFRTSPPFEVIGVVRDVRGISLEKSPAPHVYLPYRQASLYGFLSFAVKTAADPAAISPAIRTAIRELDPELPISKFRTMDEIVAGSVGQRRFQMNLVLLFAATAILLACLGIYGVMSYTVTQRTNEIGIRMALGAARAAVLRMVLRNTLELVAYGLIIGVSMALLIASSLRALLFGIDPVDPATFLISCLLLTIAAMLAAYLPARRASRVDPMVALRYE